MSTSLGVIFIVFALVLGAFCAVIWGNIHTKKEYGEGYSEGYKNGAAEKYDEVYNKRLLRQAQRATARERKNEPTNIEELDRGVSGSVESSGSEPDSGTPGLFEHDADTGPGTEPSDE